jgi:hypothetical protein
MRDRATVQLSPRTWILLCSIRRCQLIASCTARRLCHPECSGSYSCSDHEQEATAASSSASAPATVRLHHSTMIQDHNVQDLVVNFRFCTQPCRWISACVLSQGLAMWSPPIDQAQSRTRMTPLWRAFTRNLRASAIGQSRRHKHVPYCMMANVDIPPGSSHMTSPRSFSKGTLPTRPSARRSITT